MEAFFSTNTPILGRWLEPSPPSFHWPLICFGVAFWDGEQEWFTIVFATYVFVVASHLLLQGITPGVKRSPTNLAGANGTSSHSAPTGWMQSSRVATPTPWVGGGISQGGWWPVGTPPPPLENFTLLGLLSSSLIMVIINAINHEPICIAKY